MLLFVRLKGVILIVFWRMIPGFTRHLLTRVGAWQSSSSAGALTPYIYSSPLFSPPPQRGTGWCTSISTPSPSLPAISTTMFAIHAHQGDDIEIRACCSPPPGRLPSYFSAGSSSRGKSNQPTLIKCQMSHKYKTILLFLWLLS